MNINSYLPRVQELPSKTAPITQINIFFKVFRFDVCLAQIRRNLLPLLARILAPIHIFQICVFASARLAESTRRRLCQTFLFLCDIKYFFIRNNFLRVNKTGKLTEIQIYSN